MSGPAHNGLTVQRSTLLFMSLERRKAVGAAWETVENGGSQGVPVWRGPYTVNYNSLNLATTGFVVCALAAGDILVDAICVVLADWDCDINTFLLVETSAGDRFDAGINVLPSTSNTPNPGVALANYSGDPVPATGAAIPTLISSQNLTGVTDNVPVFVKQTANLRVRAVNAVGDPVALVAGTAAIYVATATPLAP